MYFTPEKTLTARKAQQAVLQAAPELCSYFVKSPTFCIWDWQRAAMFARLLVKLYPVWPSSTAVYFLGKQKLRNYHLKMDYLKPNFLL